jgi:hypothetical protein
VRTGLACTSSSASSRTKVLVRTAVRLSVFYDLQMEQLTETNLSLLRSLHRLGQSRHSGTRQEANRRPRSTTLVQIRRRESLCRHSGQNQELRRRWRGQLGLPAVVPHRRSLNFFVSSCKTTHFFPNIVAFVSVIIANAFRILFSRQ